MRSQELDGFGWRVLLSPLVAHHSLLSQFLFLLFLQALNVLLLRLRLVQLKHLLLYFTDLYLIKHQFLSSLVGFEFSRRFQSLRRGMDLYFQILKLIFAFLNLTLEMLVIDWALRTSLRRHLLRGVTT